MAVKSLKVLVLEDRVADLELILRTLRKADFDPAWTRVETEPEFRSALTEEWDVILADYTLPSFSAPAALELVKQCGRDAPLIVITGSISEEVAVECIKQGAADYLLKDRLARLGTAVEQALQHRDARRQERNARALLLESEKLRTVAGLAAGVAHEINNPLAGMVQNAQAILNRLTQETPANQQAAQRHGTTFAAIRGFITDREVVDMLESIREAGQQASRIIQNLLIYSRRDQGSSSVNLAELIERTLELAASDYELQKHGNLGGVEIVREFPAEMPAVVCHRGQMQQVLLNLIRNAVQAMRANPPERRPRLCLRAHGGGNACIEVEDNGPGIAPEHRPRLFEPFFSTKPVGEGTGLGLFLCYHIVTINHGGRFTLDSPAGGGACFRIHLPLAEGKGDAR